MDDIIEDIRNCFKADLKEFVETEVAIDIVVIAEQDEEEAGCWKRRKRRKERKSRPN